MLYVSKLKEASMTSCANGPVNTDWVTAANLAFQRENKGKSFNFESCYQILKKLHKFQTSHTFLNSPQFHFDSPQTGATNSQGTLNVGGPAINLEDDIERPYPRPPGRKEMKQWAKGKTKATNIKVNREILSSCSSFNDLFKRSCQDESVRDQQTQEGLTRSLQLKERNLKLNEHSLLALERKDNRE